MCKTCAAVVRSRQRHGSCSFEAQPSKRCTSPRTVPLYILGLPLRSTKKKHLGSPYAHPHVGELVPCQVAVISKSNMAAWLCASVWLFPCTGEKPYRCTEPGCNRGFACSHHLKDHKRIHTGEKPYRCTVCNIAFAASSNLTVHMRTHTREKPYRCTVCNTAFAESTTLARHKRTHNRGKTIQMHRARLQCCIWPQTPPARSSQ